MKKVKVVKVTKKPMAKKPKAVAVKVTKKY